MSHFARLIEPLNARTTTTREQVLVASDTEIKNVMITDGFFRFEARLSGVGRIVEGVVFPVNEGGLSWVVLETEEDLPMFTDKGRARIEAKTGTATTLRPGRPVNGEDSTAIACRVTLRQREWVNKRAARKGMSLSDYVRGLLEAEGMPS